MFHLAGVALPQPRGRKNRTHDFLHQCGQVGLFETDARCWRAVVLDVGWDMLVVWIGTGQLRDMSKNGRPSPFRDPSRLRGELVPRLRRMMLCAPWYVRPYFLRAFP